MTLPEVNLGAYTVQDHEDHHGIIHDAMNRLFDDAILVGETLTKTSPGTGLGTIGTAQTHYTFADQVQDFTHDSAGILAIAAGRQTKAIRVTASANIAGMTVGGLELVGQGFSQVWVRIEATASITVDLSGSFEVVGTAPASLASGESIAFIVQRWNT